MKHLNCLLVVAWLALLTLLWHRTYAEDESKLTPGEPVKLEMVMMPSS